MFKNDYSVLNKKDLIEKVTKQAAKLDEQDKKLDEQSKRYGLLWEDKPEKVVEQCRKNVPFLVEQKEKSIKRIGDKPTHILIEGENYYSLSVLSFTHKNKIDIIYIDPPYNNGKDKWKYNNNIVDIKDSYRHSKWLSLMSKRLILAKDLLKEDGVLICTIDRHESNRLGLLLEKIFPNKKIVCVTIVHNPRGTQGNNFSHTNEYAYFVYPSDEKRYIQQKLRNESSIEPLRRWGGESERRYGKNVFYPFIIKDLEIVDIGEIPDEDFHPKSSTIIRDDGLIEVWPIDKNGIERKWRYSADSVKEVIEDIQVIKQKNSIEIKIAIRKGNYKTVWVDKKYDASQHGTQLLGKIIDKKFPYPKSIYAVKDCLKACVHDKKNAIILDFFAGSATTAHAVLELNKDDEGQRQFIIGTSEEGDICRDIAIPRIQKVINGYDVITKKYDYGLDDLCYSEEKNVEKVSATGDGLKCFKIDFMEGEKIIDDILVEFSPHAVEIICVKENCFDEVVDTNEFKIFKNINDKYIGIICEHNLDYVKSFVEQVKKIDKKFIIYVFSYNSHISNEGFEEVENLVELRSFPYFILNINERIHE